MMLPEIPKQASMQFGGRRLHLVKQLRPVQRNDGMQNGRPSDHDRVHDERMHAFKIVQIQRYV